jgi:hypothetical protein
MRSACIAEHYASIASPTPLKLMRYPPPMHVILCASVGRPQREAGCT